MQALLIAMHLFFHLWNLACFMFQKLLSLFCFHNMSVSIHECVPVYAAHVCICTGM